MIGALIFGSLYLWAHNVASGCKVSAPARAMTPVVVCSDRKTGLTIFTVDADSIIAVEDVDKVLADARLTGDPVWSSDGSSLALEIALDEEPGVLVVRLGTRSRVHFVDKSLVPLHLSGMGPVWSPDDRWLLYHTSGTGGRLRDEGVFAYRASDGATYRVLRARVSSIAVSREHLFAIITGGGRTPSLRSYPLKELLAGASAIEDVRQPPVDRFHKE